MTDNKTYKCRAECKADIDRVRTVLTEQGVVITDEEIEQDKFEGFVLPDCVWTFKTATDLKTLRLYAGKVVDAHVIVGTLQEENNYTGERV